MTCDPSTIASVIKSVLSTKPFFMRPLLLMIRPCASEAANFVARALSLRLQEASVCDVKVLFLLFCCVCRERVAVSGWCGQFSGGPVS